MQPPRDGDYRPIIEKRQKEVSSPRSKAAADKLWDEGQADALLNKMYLEKRDRRAERNANINELLEKQRDFSDIPGINMIKEVEGRKDLSKKKPPSPRQSSLQSRNRIIGNDGTHVDRVLKQVEAYKSDARPLSRSERYSNSDSHQQLGQTTMKNIVNMVKTGNIPKGGKTSRRKKINRGGRRKTQRRRGGRRKTQRRRGGRRKSRRRRGKK